MDKIELDITKKDILSAAAALFLFICAFTVLFFCENLLEDHREIKHIEKILNSGITIEQYISLKSLE